jgi:predicted ATPase
MCRNRQLLLILDNCEHLARAVAELAKHLLQASPRMKILASSRELLQIPGEKKYSLPPLPLPEAGENATVAALAQSAAVRLFVDRAAAAQPSFRVTAENGPAIAEICRRLDGIPLALELAAARARSLTMETMAARLGDRFRLLTQGDRTALPASRRFAHASTGATTFCPAPSGHCCAGLACSRAAGCCPPPKRSATKAKCKASTSSIFSIGSCRSRWSSSTPKRIAIVCSRRCGSTRPSASSKRARKPRPARGISNSR